MLQVFLALITSAVMAYQQPLIIGGDSVQVSDLAAYSTVALKALSASGQKVQSFCSGTLISKNLILTAAHCVDGAKVEKVAISFTTEETTVYNPAMMRKVKAIKANPKFDQPAGKNDIALIVIEDVAPSIAKPIEILEPEYNLVVGQKMLLAGFGVTDDTISAEPTSLQQVRVKLAKILDTILVTNQTEGGGACNGDSGGPAYLEKNNQLYVYGITRGPHEGANDCHHYGEYTYASKFKEFILATALELNAESPTFVNP